MSDFKHKPNSGSLFVNSYKERDAQPDWTGTCDIEGKTMRIAAWENEGRNGTYLSLKFEEPRDHQARSDRTDGRARAAGRDTGTRTDPGAARRSAAVDRARAAVRDLGARPGQRTMGDAYDDLNDDEIPF